MARLLLAVTFLLLVPTSRGAEPTFHDKTLRQWETQLRNGTELERCRAATALGMGPFGKKAVPALIEGLAAKELEVRIDIHCALGMLGKNAEGALPVLSALCEVAEDRERRFIINYLLEIGPAALPFIKRTSYLENSAYLFCLSNSSHNDLKKALLDSSTRPDVVEAIAMGGKLGDEYTSLVPSLARALRDKRDHVRDQIYNILFQMGPKAKAALPELVERLDHETDWEKAIPVLSALGEPAWPALRQAVEKGPEKQRLLILNRLRPISPEALPLLLQYLGDADKERRCVAASSLNEFTIDLNPHLPLLKRLVKDQEPRIRRGVYYALGDMIGNVEAARLFATGLIDSEEHIRDWVRDRVGRSPWMHEIAKPIWRSYLKDPAKREPVINWYRTYSLRGATEVDFLIECLQDERTEIRTNVAQLLGQTRQITPAVVRALCTASQEKEPLVRLKAVLALAELGPKTRQVWDEYEGTRKEIVIPALLARLNDEIKDTRGYAAASLCRFGYPTDQAVQRVVVFPPDREAMSYSGHAGQKAIPWLMERLKSKDPLHRHGAALALGHLKIPAKDLVPALVPLLDEPELDCSREPALGAATSLLTAGESAMPSLKKALLGTNASLTKRICEEVRKDTIGVQALVPSLLQLTENETKEVRWRAWDALIRIEARGKLVFHTAVKTLRSSSEYSERLSACRCLALQGNEARTAIPDLRDALLDPQHDIREAALQAMAAIDPEGLTILPSVEDVLLSRDGWQPPTVLPVLKQLGKTARPLLPRLRELCKSREDSVRVEAALALWYVSGNREEAMTVLRSIVNDGRTSDRVNAMKHMHLISETETLPLLVRLFEEGDMEVQRRAALLIGKSGKAANPFLSRVEKLMKHPSYDVRETAARLHFQMTVGYDPIMGPTR